MVKITTMSGPQCGRSPHLGIMWLWVGWGLFCVSAHWKWSREGGSGTIIELTWTRECDIDAWDSNKQNMMADKLEQSLKAWQKWNMQNESENDHFWAHSHSHVHFWKTEEKQNWKWSKNGQKMATVNNPISLQIQIHWAIHQIPTKDLPPHSYIISGCCLVDGCAGITSQPWSSPLGS